VFGAADLEGPFSSAQCKRSRAACLPVAARLSMAGTKRADPQSRRRTLGVRVVLTETLRSLLETFANRRGGAALPHAASGISTWPPLRFFTSCRTMSKTASFIPPAACTGGLQPTTSVRPSQKPRLGYSSKQNGRRLLAAPPGVRIHPERRTPPPSQLTLVGSVNAEIRRCSRADYPPAPPRRGNP